MNEIQWAAPAAQSAYGYLYSSIIRLQTGYLLEGGSSGAITRHRYFYIQVAPGSKSNWVEYGLIIPKPILYNRRI